MCIRDSPVHALRDAEVRCACGAAARRAALQDQRPAPDSLSQLVAPSALPMRRAGLAQVYRGGC
eukprot:3697328-Rhodomonas_salina.2